MTENAQQNNQALLDAGAALADFDGYIAEAGGAPDVIATVVPQG